MACWDTLPPGRETDPPGADTLPQEQTPPTSRHALEQTPPVADSPQGADPPGADPPLHSACWEIRPTSGQYASYWNAYLFN